MTIFHRLGRALRFLRERQGRSQKEVAAAANITPPMLSAYENERSCPEIDTLDRILRLGLAATLEDLRWAIDVVNDRAAASPDAWRTPHAAAPAVDPSRPALLGSVQVSPSSLPPELEQGCAELARGLLRMSQAMVAVVAQANRRKGD